MTPVLLAESNMSKSLGKILYQNNQPISEINPEMVKQNSDIALQHSGKNFNPFAFSSIRLELVFQHETEISKRKSVQQVFSSSKQPPPFFSGQKNFAWLSCFEA